MVFAFTASIAQDYSKVKDSGSDAEIKTLFKKPQNERKDISVGWSVGINSAYTQYDKKNVWLVGFTAGPVLNHNWTLGIQMNAVVNSSNLYFDMVDNTYSGGYLVGGYGGFLFQYTLFPKSAVHVTFPLQIGGGYLGYLSDYGYHWENGHGNWNDSEILAYDIFFFIEPGIQAEFNLLKFMRLALGVSYRYTPYFPFESTTSDLFNQFNGTVGLKFGKF
jgi:hypothetical protein